MFAGDKPAADASYRNLFWENFHVYQSFNIGTKIRKNKEIGTIDSWGPFFRVSFDLIIHSHVDNFPSSVLAFKGNGGTYDCCEIGDRIPAIFVSQNLNQNLGQVNPLHLHFGNSVNQNGNYNFDFYINLNSWYKIVIEQKLAKDRKVKRKFPSLFNNSYII